jgi:hypothetical protein
MMRAFILFLTLASTHPAAAQDVVAGRASVGVRTGVPSSGRVALVRHVRGGSSVVSAGDIGELSQLLLDPIAFSNSSMLRYFEVRQ